MNFLVFIEKTTVHKDVEAFIVVYSIVLLKLVQGAFGDIFPFFFTSFWRHDR